MLPKVSLLDRAPTPLEPEDHKTLPGITLGDIGRKPYHGHILY